MTGYHCRSKRAALTTAHDLANRLGRVAYLYRPLIPGTSYSVHTEPPETYSTAALKRVIDHDLVLDVIRPDASY